MAALLLVPRAARAEAWWVGAAPVAEATTAGEFSMRGGWAPGYVPPFRSGQRERFAAGFDASLWMLGRVRLGANWEWLVDDTAAAGPVSGPGDVRLGTAVRLFGNDAWSCGVGWEVKLPNATNEDQLGTDETDALFGAWGRWRGGPWSAAAAVGLGVLGNPLRFANQDDVPLLRLEGAWRREPAVARVFVEADLPTARNPARAMAGGAIRVGATWFVEAEGAAGLTAAAADGRLLLRVGVAGGLPVRGRGE